MKRVLVSMGFIVVLLPMFAAAASLDQIRQLSATVATLKAQEAALSQPLACAVFASKNTVQVGEQFAIAWGSVGAAATTTDPSMLHWDSNGAVIVAISMPGTYRYNFTFQGENGGKTTCETLVTAH